MKKSDKGREDMQVQERQYSATEISDLVGLSRAQVNNYIRYGDLPAERVGRIYVIQESGLRHFLKHWRDGAMLHILDGDDSG